MAMSKHEGLSAGIFAGMNQALKQMFKEFRFGVPTVCKKCSTEGPSLCDDCEAASLALEKMGFSSFSNSNSRFSSCQSSPFSESSSYSTAVEFSEDSDSLYSFSGLSTNPALDFTLSRDSLSSCNSNTLLDLTYTDDSFKSYHTPTNFTLDSSDSLRRGYPNFSANRCTLDSPSPTVDSFTSSHTLNNHVHMNWSDKDITVTKCSSFMSSTPVNGCKPRQSIGQRIRRASSRRDVGGNSQLNKISEKSKAILRPTKKYLVQLENNNSDDNQRHIQDPKSKIPRPAGLPTKDAIPSTSGSGSDRFKSPLSTRIPKLVSISQTKTRPPCNPLRTKVAAECTMIDGNNNKNSSKCPSIPRSAYKVVCLKPFNIRRRSSIARSKYNTSE